MNPVPPPLLIVEDNPVYAEILQRLLPALGADLRFTPKWVDNAEKALMELQGNSYELVLLDYKLPGADGLSVLAQIRRMPTAKQPAVIMLTGMGNEAIAVEAMKRGAKDYLPKDNLDVPSLVRAITSALERKRLEEQVARYTEELRQKNAQMQTDLNMACEVQQAFLPQQYPSFPRDVGPGESALRFYHRYHPTRSVGGDFFDVLALSDTQAGVFICDVMGHGVRAALVTAMLRALAEELAPVGCDPSRFLSEINRRLLTILRQTRTPMFASAFYLIADLGKGELRYANAGHPSPLLLRRKSSVAAPLRFDNSKSGPALGVFEESKFETCSCGLSPGDLVVLYTDGLFEVEGANDELYGQERLLAALQERIKFPAEQVLDGVINEIQQFAINREFSDDVCLVGLEVARVGLDDGAGNVG